MMIFRRLNGWRCVYIIWTVTKGDALESQHICSKGDTLVGTVNTMVTMWKADIYEQGYHIRLEIIPYAIKIFL